VFSPGERSDLSFPALYIEREKVGAGGGSRGLVSVLREAMKRCIFPKEGKRGCGLDRSQEEKEGFSGFGSLTVMGGKL